MFNNKIKNIPIWQKFQQRIEATPTLPTEESILLRILVQVLVIIGIIATDVAAQTQISFWAIPLSIGGAIISWQRRRKRNIELKFILAIAMLIVLGSFLSSLNFHDRRVGLAQLLIQLQVIHSFDVPRRKDLGYSMVIGLILVAVAGTIAQTMAFAPWLLLFLAVALPTLVLDYRSRLGLETINNFYRPKSNVASPSRPRFNILLSPLRLGLILIITLLIGLIIFASLPRFAGYQLQTFPVSGPEELTNKGFEGSPDIVNPGYIREGREIEEGENGAGWGQSPTEGAGQANMTFYYGFSRKMNQNLRGEMIPELVMRVRSQAPGFWRVMGFDYYTGQGWEVSRQEQVSTLSRSLWRYRFYAGIPALDTATKQVIQSYTMVSPLPSVIPALSYPEYIYFPAREVAIDAEGGLRAPALLTDGLTYTIISQVPYRDRTLLREANGSYTETIAKYYLQIPPEIKEKIRTEAERLLDKSPQPITSNYEKALYLGQALKQNYAIIPDLPFFDDNEDLVSAFLFRYQGGYPDHFSTVLTVMLRSLGIPARLAVGFDTGKFNPFTGYYLVNNTDALALTEVYFPGYGWFAFNPIPGHELIPPSFQEHEAFSILKQFWRWVAGFLPPPFVEMISLLWNGLIERLLQILNWLWKLVSGSIIGLFFGIIIGLLALFLSWLGWKQIKGWKYSFYLAKLPPMERLYQQMLTLLKSQGYPKHPAQTPFEYVNTSSQYYSPEQAAIIAEISQAYVGWRYGKKIPDLKYYQQQFKRLKKMFSSLKFKGLSVNN